MIVVASYFFFLLHRIYDYGNAQIETQTWLWAIFKSRVFFLVWLFFAAAATVSYMGIFFWVVCRNDKEKWSDNMIQFTVFNALFLFFSSLYAFLVFRVFKESHTMDFQHTLISRVLVMADLLLVALFSGLMTYSIALEYGLGREFGLAIVLLFHCTVMDLILWGIYWFNSPIDGIYHERRTLIFFGAALDADPSTMGIFSRLRIRTCDYGAV